LSWPFGGKKKSSEVAKDRLKLVLIYDRQGTTTNDNMIQMMKRDL
jgi:cell division topological specificity factor